MGRTPEGAPVPPGGPLADIDVDVQSLSLYLHVPFCSVRCGYCDFNTYTAEELSRDGVVASREQYIRQAVVELRQARRDLGARDISIDTIFVGGGTPTLLPAEHFGEFLNACRELFDVGDDIEITVEANPDTLDAAYLERLRATGVNRLSLGMQSAVGHMLEVLERTHNPANVAMAANAARAAGFEHISVDLIYGTPSESLADWQKSLEVATSLPVDHISAYALIVEEGTKLAAQVARGEVVMPEDDETAEKYLLADDHFSAQGLDWYEVSNWSLSDGQCRHNLAYWRSASWWGVGPGAHSHVNGVRWWNVKHPAAYAARLAAGESPALHREVLTASERMTEEILLRIRLREGLALTLLDARQRATAADQVSAGLASIHEGAMVLTQRGRLMADAVVRDLLA